MMLPPFFSPASRLRSWPRRSNYSCLVSLPEGYAERGAATWPLLLFLHGSAFCGDNLAAVASHGLPRLLSGAGELTAAETAVARELATRFIVVAPQCPAYEVWDDARLIALLDDVQRDFNVATARVYLTGLSMGGFGTWSTGLRHPSRFAALAPVCGGGRIADVLAAQRSSSQALSGLGVWAFHGAQDTVVPLEESARMVEALQQAGLRDVRLTIYPEAAHDAWSATYANPALYAWLLQHAREPRSVAAAAAAAGAPSRPVVARDSNESRDARASFPTGQLQPG